ncbi:MAG: acyl-ACP--UDP-N-acetylglucosamine O-acyltransferase [Planctomycetia bacterium]|nr:acyl-ACP--UDP-N-acetylglucosamine O-acyltransferase [Planctomycetia bacterium]MBL6914925.1 acyl-ACP--UDP-N-acetylglucosamine O-acyltransferase [Planctomycetota bacterium]
MSIHPTAVIHESAKIGKGVEVGPFCQIGKDVTIGDGCKIFSHAYIGERTVLGESVEVHMQVVVGHEPQDLTWAREPSSCEIGAHTVLREFSTVHRASRPGGKTQIGQRCLLMVGSHVAHDCEVGDGVILANHCSLAGHVKVGDGAFLSANSLVHQFCRVGRFVMLGGAAVAVQDIPSFMLSTGDRAVIRGVNVIGLRRAGFSADIRRAIQDAHRLLFRGKKTIPEATELLLQSKVPEILELANFIADSARGVATGVSMASFTSQDQDLPQ